MSARGNHNQHPLQRLCFFGSASCALRPFPLFFFSLADVAVEAVAEPLPPPPPVSSFFLFFSEADFDVADTRVSPDLLRFRFAGGGDFDFDILLALPSSSSPSSSRDSGFLNKDMLLYDVSALESSMQRRQ